MTEFYQTTPPGNEVDEPQHTIDGQPISEYFANLDYTPEGNFTKFKTAPDILLEFSKIQFNSDTSEQVYNPAVSHHPQIIADNFANNSNILEIGPKKVVYIPEPGYGGKVGPIYIAYNIDSDPDVDIMMKVHRTDASLFFGENLAVWVDYLDEADSSNHNGSTILDYDLKFDLTIQNLSLENVSSSINYEEGLDDNFPAFIGSYDPSTNQITVNPELFKDLELLAQDKSIITSEAYLLSDQYNNQEWLLQIFRDIGQAIKDIYFSVK